MVTEQMELLNFLQTPANSLVSGPLQVSEIREKSVVVLRVGIG